MNASNGQFSTYPGFCGAQRLRMALRPLVLVTAILAQPFSVLASPQSADGANSRSTDVTDSNYRLDQAVPTTGLQVQDNQVLDILFIARRGGRGA